jgi:hypothetical protein
MAKYLRPPSESQQRFLETLRDLGPRDNAQTAEVLRGTRHACQCRGWAEWRALDNFPSVKAWHLTIIGRRVLSSVQPLVNLGSVQLAKLGETLDRPAPPGPQRAPGPGTHCP